MLISQALVGISVMTACVTAAERDSFNWGANLIEGRDDLFQDVEGQFPQSIVGGDEIVPGTRPYLVPVRGLVLGRLTLCGGSLISPHAVMTAAGCVYGSRGWHPPTYVEFHRNSFLNNTGVKCIYINDRSQCNGDVVYHPEYNYSSFENSVAIIFLPEAINDITPVELNEDPNVPIPGAPLDFAGWGWTDRRLPSLSNVPNALTLDYATNEVCNKRPYRWSDAEAHDSIMCAISDRNSSACFGDAGGPLVLGKREPTGGPLTPVVQVGIHNFLWYPCGDGNRYPDGFTRVSKVVDWVKDTVCKRTGELCKSSKSGKNSKTKKMYPSCVRLPTEAPTDSPTTYSPTITAQPITAHPTFMPTVTAYPTTSSPTDMPTTFSPTWMPTSEAPTKRGKSNKLN